MSLHTTSDQNNSNHTFCLPSRRAARIFPRAAPTAPAEKQRRDTAPGAADCRKGDDPPCCLPSTLSRGINRLDRRVSLHTMSRGPLCPTGCVPPALCPAGHWRATAQPARRRRQGRGRRAHSSDWLSAAPAPTGRKGALSGCLPG